MPGATRNFPRSGILLMIFIASGERPALLGGQELTPLIGPDFSYMEKLLTLKRLEYNSDTFRFGPDSGCCFEV